MKENKKDILFIHLIENKIVYFYKLKKIKKRVNKRSGTLAINRDVTCHSLPLRYIFALSLPLKSVFPSFFPKNSLFSADTQTYISKTTIPDSLTIGSSSNLKSWFRTYFCITYRWDFWDNVCGEKNVPRTELSLFS